jgi:hypothetical protein
MLVVRRYNLLVKYHYSYDKFTITDTSILFLSYKGSGNWLTFFNNWKIERLDVETSVIENIATGHVYANGLDIHYNKGFVYWTDYDKIMRYDIHYNTGFVYLTDVVDKRIITYFIAHFIFPQEIPLASGSVNA